MPSLNRITIIGHAGADPEVRTMPDGKKIAGFSVAVNDGWTDRRTGERIERTEWFRVSIKSDHVVDVAERFIRKGSLVYVEGSLQTRKYTDREGQERSIVEVVLSPFHGTLQLLDAKPHTDDDSE